MCSTEVEQLQQPKTRMEIIIYLLADLSVVVWSFSGWGWGHVRALSADAISLSLSLSSLNCNTRQKYKENQEPKMIS